MYSMIGGEFTCRVLNGHCSPTMKVEDLATFVVTHRPFHTPHVFTISIRSLTKIVPQITLWPTLILIQLNYYVTCAHEIRESKFAQRYRTSIGSNKRYWLELMRTFIIIYVLYCYRTITSVIDRSLVIRNW
jgi:hypothetical protein